MSWLTVELTSLNIVS